MEWLSSFPSLTTEANIFDDNPNPEDLKALVSKLKKVRTATTARPDSLQICASKCIGKNMHRFLTLDTLTKGHSNNNPFANLPKSMAHFLANTSKFYKHSSDKSELLCFFLQLQNPQITEYIGHKLWSRNSVHRTRLKESMHEPTIFKHLLANCPKIEMVKINICVWADLEVERPVDILDMMASRWPNLTNLTISSENNIKSSDLVMEMISKHLPSLSDLDIDLWTSNLTMDGVKHFAQMHKLKNLCLQLTDRYLATGNVVNVVHAVGQLPAIETLSLHGLNSAFVDLFGQLYPRKKLTLRSFTWSNSDLKYAWPECLTLKSLNILGQGHGTNILDTEIYKTILSGNCFPESFFCEGISLTSIYAFVKKFGPAGLTDLAFLHSGDEPLDVLMVLSLCPKLKSIYICCGDIVENSDFTVKDEQFQVCQRFIIILGNKRQSTASELFRKYLLNSRMFLRKSNYNMWYLDDILWALNQEKHTCLDQINEIRFDNYNRHYDSPINENKGFKIALLLAMRSPKLERVVLNNFKSVLEMPDWYRDLFKKLQIALICDDE